jgi:Na+/phosphate symporter
MALVLGENIGTTITAELATIGSNNINAHRAARAHTMFNVLGVTLMLMRLSPVRKTGGDLGHAGHSGPVRWMRW